MIPQNVLSTESVYGPLLEPNGVPYGPFHDWEMGGVALQDPTQGFLVKRWSMRVVGLRTVEIRPGIENWMPVFTWNSDIDYASFAFDSNMNVVVTFVSKSGSFIYWFDPIPNQYTFYPLPSGIRTPRTSLDEKRPVLDQYRDTLVSYFRGGNLCIRNLSQRFTVEHVLATGQPINAEIIDFGMNSHQRMQWGLRNVNLPGAVSFEGVPLSDVVLNLCERAGISSEFVNVNELHGDRVMGMKVAVDEGLDKPIDWLREIFFFDKAEYDRKIHFLKRGRGVVARIPYKHLVEGSPKALKQELADEKKLPRLVNINHLDPDAGHAKNKQTAERRSNLIQTDVKKNIESQVVLTVDQAATAAAVRLKVYHNELVEYEFSTTLMYAHLTTTDVVEVEDSEGDWHRMRLEEKNEDSGIIEWEGTQDAGDLTYKAQRVGNALPPPVSTTPGLVSQTQIEIINVSPFRDQDDELGVYIAASGETSVWTGYQLLYSIDNGTSYIEAFRGEIPSTIGLTDTDLLEEVSAEYQADQSVEVTVNFPLSSVSYDQLLQGQNRICIGDEILQFETATMLGMDGSRYRYRLDGLVRGRYNTEPLHWPAGTRFVLIDESLVFAQTQRSLIGADIVYKPVSFGLSEDEVVPTAYLFDEPFSQIEWPVTKARMEKDSAGNIRVSWIGRARLGTDSSPVHSKYFSGYRLVYSDDFSVDLPINATEHYRNRTTSNPANVTIYTLNSITGANSGVVTEAILVPEVKVPSIVIDGGEVVP